MFWNEFPMPKLDDLRSKNKHFALYVLQDRSVLEVVKYRKRIIPTGFNNNLKIEFGAPKGSYC